MRVTRILEIPSLWGPWRAAGMTLWLVGAALGCSGGDGSSKRAREQAVPGAGGFGNAEVGGNGAGGFGNSGRSAVGGAAAPVAPRDDQACAEVNAGAELEPVHLAFAFDVSGSMGKGDEEWHDKALKWDPVVLATRTFFEDPASAGLTASLTFFPSEGDEDERCVLDTYTMPDVPMTPLPSDEFGAAIDAITPMSADDWRGGTPTAWVMRGTLAFVTSYREQHPGRFAIVLVTDGYPQGCDDADDTIEAVTVEAEGALASEITTYVIGVANPPIDGAPDTVSNLHAIALAGGTDQAFLIDTGDPAQTSSAFTSAVDAIRGVTISCSLAIPAAPDGRAFDKERVGVSYESGAGETTALRYEPGCNGDDVWHYDDPADPSQIVLCDATCERVKADPAAQLGVRFACEQLLSVD